ncbi:hypothetical protein M7784_02830 [Desulfovibrio aminophilus]|nr:hypothetical protein [Desulfovibrio aminophilus]MCM0754178.1 hypothetical protein [Desulfovibrio aminophilus]
MGNDPFCGHPDGIEWVPKPDFLLDEAIVNGLYRREPSISVESVDRIEAIYRDHIRKLKAELDRVKHERNRAIMGKNALGDVLDEYAEMLGKPQDEVMARYKEQLKRESEKQGIPLD